MYNAMNQKIITLFLFSVISISFIFADRENDEFKKQFWVTEAFKEVQIPEKFLSSSCVILNRSYDYAIRPMFSLGPNRVEVVTSFHMRIKLLDKAGVDEYTTFSIDGDMEKGVTNRKRGTDLVFAGFKIIKNDGIETEINLDEILVTDEAQKGKAKATLNKISIPNLVVGDVLDYYIVRRNRTMYQYVTFIGDANTVFLEGEYPIVEQSLTISSKRYCYLSCRSMNGAPDIKPLSKKQEGVYRLVDYNRDASKDEKWVNHYLESPFVRFQGIFSIKPYANYPTGFYRRFLTSTEDLRTAISMEELTRYAKDISTWKKQLISYPIPNIKLVKTATAKEKVDRILMECKRQSLSMFSENYFYSPDKRQSWNQDEMAVILSKVLIKHKIKSSLIFTTNRNFLKLDDLFMKEDIAVLVKIECDGQVFYISDLDALTNYAEIDPRYYGNKGYELDLYPKSKQNVLRSVTILQVKPEENKLISSLKVELDIDSLKSRIEYNKKMIGAGKLAEQYSLIGRNDFYKEFSTNFAKLISIESSSLKSSIKEKKTIQISDLEKGFSENRSEFIKKNLKEEFNITNDLNFENFKINNSGIYPINAIFEYSLSFSTEQFIRKVGSNYILDAGKLLGTQVSFSDTEKNNRTHNIYFTYPRTFENIIEILIPNGYRVKGIEAFNVNQQTEVGRFTSTAKIDGNSVVISTIKTYNQTYSPKEQFNQYISFVDCAFNLSQKYLLFEKIK